MNSVPDHSKCFRRITTPEVSLDQEDADLANLQGEPVEEDIKMKDDGILAGFKMSDDLANICHIDSSETSDDSPEIPAGCEEGERRKSLPEGCNYSQFKCYHSPTPDRRASEIAEIDATNLISTSPEDEEDDEGFELNLNTQSSKRCSIAHFVDGFDIARKSIKCRHRHINDNIDSEPELTTTNETSKFLDVPIIQIEASSDDDDASRNETPTNKLLDLVNIRINGSNNNLSSMSDPSMVYLDKDFGNIDHRKSLAPSEADDEELKRIHEMAEGAKTRLCEGPIVVIDPPSPPMIHLTLPEEDETGDYMRRPSFEFCRKCKY